MVNEQKLIRQSLSKVDLRELSHKGNFVFVTGVRSFEESKAKEMLSDLIDDPACFHINDFSTNPNIHDLRRLLPLIRSIEPKTIVAIGGGSCLDIAKLLKVFANATDDPISFAQQTDLLHELPGNDIRLIAIPTTAGSGSEATEFAVLYGEMKEKYSISRKDMRPQIVIHDASLTFSQTLTQTACSGLDCLVQAIESFWSKRATPVSQDYARKAIGIAKESLPEVIHSPNEKNRSEMQQAAYYAGSAINISKTTAPHAFSYYLTSHYNVAHGHAVALLMSYLLLYHDSHYKNEPVFNDICALLSVENLKEAQEFITNLLKECHLETNILSFISSNDIYDNFFAAVNLERLNNHPVNIKKEDFCRILGLETSS